MALFEGMIQHLNVDVDLHPSGIIGLAADSANFLCMVCMEAGGVGRRLVDTGKASSGNFGNFIFIVL